MVPVSNVISTSSSYLQDYELSDGLRRDIVKNLEKKYGPNAQKCAAKIQRVFREYRLRKQWQKLQQNDTAKSKNGIRNAITNNAVKAKDTGTGTNWNRIPVPYTSAPSKLPVSAPLSAQLRVERLHPINDESILNSGEQRRSVIELMSPRLTLNRRVFLPKGGNPRVASPVRNIVVNPTLVTRSQLHRDFYGNNSAFNSVDVSIATDSIDQNSNADAMSDISSNDIEKERGSKDITLAPKKGYYHRTASPALSNNGHNNKFLTGSASSSQNNFLINFVYSSSPDTPAKASSIVSTNYTNTQTTTSSKSNSQSSTPQKRSTIENSTKKFNQNQTTAKNIWATPSPAAGAGVNNFVSATPGYGPEGIRPVASSQSPILLQQLPPGSTTFSATPGQQSRSSSRRSSPVNSLTKLQKKYPHPYQPCQFFHGYEMADVNAFPPYLSKSLPRGSTAVNSETCLAKHQQFQQNQLCLQQQFQQMRIGAWNEQQRHRQYRIALNFFNKKPDLGIQLLTNWGFIDGNPRTISFMFLDRRGFSKQKIGDYLGTRNSPLHSKVLDHFLAEIPMYDMEVDKALRQLFTTFRNPAEPDKIDYLMEAFAARYMECNPYRLKDQGITRDTIYTLAFAIIMLNTDLHSQALRNSKRMRQKEFIDNILGVKACCHLDKKMLAGIYDRVKEKEFKVGTDHVSQVAKVDESIISKSKPKLVESHRRLICYCRLNAVTDPNKTQSPKLFLFNDLLLVCKVANKRKSIGQYELRYWTPLIGLNIQQFTNSYYPFGILFSCPDGQEFIFNAKNFDDRLRFTADIKESIIEATEMEQWRIRLELIKQQQPSSNYYLNTAAGTASTVVANNTYGCDKKSLQQKQGDSLYCYSGNGNCCTGMNGQVPNSTELPPQHRHSSTSSTIQRDSGLPDLDQSSASDTPLSCNVPTTIHVGTDFPTLINGNNKFQNNSSTCSNYINGGKNPARVKVVIPH